MDHDLKEFVLSMLRAALPAAMLVATAAFITIPYTLGHHPGEPSATEQMPDRHMT
jgi:hypothetical protein